MISQLLRIEHYLLYNRTFEVDRAIHYNLDVSQKKVSGIINIWSVL